MGVVEAESALSLPVLEVKPIQAVYAAFTERWQLLDEVLPDFSRDPQNVEFAKKWLRHHDERIQRLGICVLQHSAIELEDEDITFLEGLLDHHRFINFGHAAITLSRKGVHTGQVKDVQNLREVLTKTIDLDEEVAGVASDELEQFGFDGEEFDEPGVVLYD